VANELLEINKRGLELQFFLQGREGIYENVWYTSLAMAAAFIAYTFLHIIVLLSRK